MSKNEVFYNKLVSLLVIFKNRPYHLAKYLQENKAFSEDFINNLIDSEKISSLSKKEIKNFKSISEMEDFYTSLINDIEGKTEKEIEKKINEKMDNLLINEKYEEAVKLRDYMKRKKIKRINL